MYAGKKIGLALSGGGIRGAIHLGILKVLKENHIYPDVISGTSAGSIAGAILAAEVDIDYFLETLMSYKGFELLDPHFTGGYLLLLLYHLWTHKPWIKWTLPDGIIRGDKLEGFFENIFQGKAFSELSIPLFIVSVDIETRDTVIFCSEELKPRKKIKNTVFITDAKVSEGIRASISLPGIFIPKKIKGKKLIDGGVKNNIPVDVLSYQQVSKILAVDLSVPKGVKAVDSIPEILMSSMDIMWHELSEYIRATNPGYFIYPRVSNVGYKDFKKIPSLVKQGEKIGLKELQEIKNYLDR